MEVVKYLDLVYVPFLDNYTNEIAMTPESLGLRHRYSRLPTELPPVELREDPQGHKIDLSQRSDSSPAGDDENHVSENTKAIADAEVKQKCNAVVQKYLAAAQEINTTKRGPAAYRAKQAALYGQGKGSLWSSLCTELGLTAQYTEGLSAIQSLTRDVKGSSKSGNFFTNTLSAITGSKKNVESSSRLGNRLRAACDVVPEAKPYLTQIIESHEKERVKWVR